MTADINSRKALRLDAPSLQNVADAFKISATAGNISIYPVKKCYTITLVQ